MLCQEFPTGHIKTPGGTLVIHISAELSRGVTPLPCLVRLSGAAARAGEGFVVAEEVQHGTDSSSTNRLRYANYGCRGNGGETGSCDDVTLCFELLPPAWM